MPSLSRSLHGIQRSHCERCSWHTRGWRDTVRYILGIQNIVIYSRHTNIDIFLRYKNSHIFLKYKNIHTNTNIFLGYKRSHCEIYSQHTCRCIQSLSLHSDNDNNHDSKEDKVNILVMKQQPWSRWIFHWRNNNVTTIMKISVA